MIHLHSSVSLRFGLMGDKRSNHLGKSAKAAVNQL